MLKNVSKLAGLLLLLVLSFIYTDSVFDGAKKTDPVMKEIISYKNEHDVLGVEPVIEDDEMIIGYAGLVVDEDESYKNMKEEDKFDEEKIVFLESLPKTTISKTYDYYIKQGNPSKKEVAIIFKIDSSNKVDALLSLVAKHDVVINFFVDGAFLEKNVETGFSMVNLSCEIYNLGYNGNYQKSMMSMTNNLIESITLKDSSFCLNDDKNDEAKKICKDKKMHTIIPTMSNPSLSDLKSGLIKGAIIAYDLRDFNLDTFSMVIKTITSKGYKITGLSSVVNEGLK